MTGADLFADASTLDAGHCPLERQVMRPVAADDDPDAPPEFGCCLPPGECCMPGLHFPSECHTAADYERAQFGGWATQPTRNA